MGSSIGTILGGAAGFALGGPAGAALGASLGSGVDSRNASQTAANTLAGATNNANGLQWNMYQQSRADQTPWRNAGGAAVNQLAYLMGLPGYGYAAPSSMGQAMGGKPASGIEGWVPKENPMNPVGSVASSRAALGMQGGPPVRPDNISPNDWAAYGPTQMPDGSWSDGTPGASLGAAMNGGAAGFAPNTAMGGYGSLATPFSQTNWQTDPGYQFRLGEGMKALERSAAAKGMTLSGAQQKSLANYNQNFASNEYGNVYNRYNNDQNTLFNRLSGLAGTGQSATNMMSSLGQNTANAMSGNLMNMGGGQAASYLAGNNAMQGGINSAMNFMNNPNSWNSMSNWFSQKWG